MGFRVEPISNGIKKNEKHQNESNQLSQTNSNMRWREIELTKK